MSNDTTQEVPHAILKESPVYRDFKRQDQNRDGGEARDTECKHHRWMKRCSFCSSILESDSQYNFPVGESLRVSYTEIDALVCTFPLAIKLQKARLTQKSKLYWMEKIDVGVVSLRCRSNVTLKGTRVAAAFSSSELVKCLYRLPAEIRTPEFFEYVGRNAHDPNRLARLMLKHAKYIKHRSADEGEETDDNLPVDE